MQKYFSIPDSPVFSTHYQLQEVKNNFCRMIAVQKRIYRAKVNFYLLAILAGTKTGDSGIDKFKSY